MSDDVVESFRQIVVGLRLHLEEERKGRKSLPVSKEFFLSVHPLSRKEPASTKPIPPPVPPPASRVPEKKVPREVVRVKEEAVPEAVASPSFVLEPPKEIFSSPVARWGEVLQRVAPQVMLRKEPCGPSLEEEEVQVAPRYIVVHTALSGPEMAFVHNVAKALEKNGGPVVLWDMDGKGGFMGMPEGSVEWVVATDAALAKAPGEVFTEGKAIRWGKYPVIVMAPPVEYLNDPARKRQLWEQLRSTFPG